MIFVRLSFFLVVFALPALSQEMIVVRSGEHSSYSRLVFPVQNEEFWELRIVGRTGILKLPTTNTYNVDQVFERIPKTRLLSIRPKVTESYHEFTMKLGCDCDVIAQIDQGNLILDVRDEAITLMEDDNNLHAESSSNEKPLVKFSSNSDSVQTNIIDRTTEAESLADTLIKQFDRATELGYIDRPELRIPDVKETTTPSEALAEEDAEDNGTNFPNLSLDGLDDLGERLDSLSTTPNLTSSSIRLLPLDDEVVLSTDINSTPESTGTDDAVQIEEDFSYCLSDDQIDVGFWADDRSYSEQVSQLQNDVFGEFDKPNRQGIIKLVQFYIFFGMGVEAISVLNDLDFEDEQSKLLAEMASILEDVPSISHGILENSSGCPGLVSLWSVLEGQSDALREFSIGVDVIVEHFATLPINIRRIVGHRLIETLLEQGFVEEADRVFSIIDRTSGLQGDLHEISKALLMHKRGSKKEAESILWKMANTPSIESKRALLLLFDFIYESRQIFPDKMSNLLGEMSFEYRGTDSGLKLKAAEIIVTSVSVSPMRALEMIAQEISLLPSNAEVYLPLVDEVLSISDLATLSKADFANFILDNRALFWHENVSDKSKVSLANYLLGIGLPNLALQITQELSSNSDPQFVNVDAMIHFRSDKASTYDTLLQNDLLSGEHSIRILERMGRFREAFDLALRSRDEGKIRQTAWRSGNWDYSKDHADDAISLLSKWMADISPRNFGGVLFKKQNIDQPKSFLEYANLSGSSRQIRDALKRILGDH